MPSYYLKNGKKYDFRFFEIRNWDDSQEYYANEYFKFKVNENDLLCLGFIYWAHIAMWQLDFSNKDTNKLYSLNVFKKAILSKFEELDIYPDPPNFGYDNPDLNVSAFSWDFPKFRVKNITENGFFVTDEDKEEFYFDLYDSDICSIEDLEYEDKEVNVGTIFSCNPGDPVFMSDDDFDLIRLVFISKIKTLNNIYSKIKFPNLIELDTIT